MGIGQSGNLNDLADIDNNLHKLAIPAWVWDADRNRIISANGYAVKFWNELSVLDLIDTVFSASHPVSFQFANAINYLKDAPHCISVAIDFSDIDISEPVDCQFTRLTAVDGRNIILMKIANEVTVAPLVEPKTPSTTLEADDMVAKMLDNSPVALALFDSEGRFNYANKQCQKIFANSTDQFVEPDSLADWFVDDEEKFESPGSTAQNLIEKCIKYNIANISVKLGTAFGARIHSIIAKSFAIKPSEDGSQYILIYMRDVADERHYEQILIDRISKLEQLTQLGSDFFFILDKELSFVQVSGNFEELTGHAAADLLGQNWQDIASRFNLDPMGIATTHFTNQTSFDHLNIQWPIKNSNEKLPLSWRGRSIFEQQQGENQFVGNFVAAIENIALAPAVTSGGGKAELDITEINPPTAPLQTSKPYELEALVGALSAVGVATGVGAISKVSEEAIGKAKPIIAVETIVEALEPEAPIKQVDSTTIQTHEIEKIVLPTVKTLTVETVEPEAPKRQVEPAVVQAREIEHIVLPTVNTVVEPKPTNPTEPLPIVEQIIVDKPIVGETVVEEKVVSELIVAEPIAEEAATGEPTNEPIKSTESLPIVEQIFVDEPIVDEPIVDETIVEETVVSELIVSEPIAEEAATGKPTSEPVSVLEAAIEQDILGVQADEVKIDEDDIITAILDELPPEPKTASDNLNAKNDDEAQKADDIAFAAQETNLSDIEAVNFANLAEALSDSKQTETISDNNIFKEGIIDSNIATDKIVLEDVNLEKVVLEDIVIEDIVIEEFEADEYSANKDIEENNKAEKDNDATEKLEDAIVAEDTIVSEDTKSDLEEPINDDETLLAANIVPAFGATEENIAKFGRSEIDIFKMVLDQTPIMAAITSLPAQDNIYTLFANKEFLHYLGIIENKNQEISSLEYANLLSVESMELLHSIEAEFGDIPVDREISFLVNGVKTYYNAKINKIKWRDEKALQFILTPNIELEQTGKQPIDNDADTDIKIENESKASQTADFLQFSLDGQAFIDENQIILSCNQKMADLVGRDDPSYITGKSIDSIISPDQVGAFNDYLFSVLQDEPKNLNIDGLEVSLQSKNGALSSVYLHIRRLKTDDAKYLPSRILVSLRDVSEFRDKEAKLRDAKEQAELENQQKSGFLARISHELRTPLNAIIGFSDVMSNEKFGPLENNRYKGYAHDINESGAHLLSLINDLLDLSKVEAGKVELNFKALDLEPLIIQAVALMQPMADKKRIIIRTSVSSTLPQIVADTRSIRQILLNLLSNSIKYSNSGSQVILSALLDEEGEVIIRVRDTGIGMNESQLNTAMEPFKTLDMANLAETQSTGLGLPLAKALAEANRAEFTIESAVNAGTLVQITFPTTRVLDT